MTESEKIAAINAMTGASESDDLLRTYLKLAEGKMLNRLFPYGGENQTLPAKYDALQCEIVAYMLNKRGAEGQTAHSENGISRSYGSADIPAELLSQLVPHVGVM